MNLWLFLIWKSHRFYLNKSFLQENMTGILIDVRNYYYFAINKIFMFKSK